MSTPTLGVIGNISIDTALYPGGQRHDLLGGAALHVALAAAGAGIHASPISVVGGELLHLRTDPRLAELDLAQILTVHDGESARFEITYNETGEVTGIDSRFGVAERLTEHAVRVIAGREFDHWHVCCRRPLDSAQILTLLMTADATFSLDFHLASIHEQFTAAAPALRRTNLVFVNASEYASIRHLSERLVVKPPFAVVVSDGPRPATLLRNGRTVATARPDHSPVSEVTGAGDTLAGTFIAQNAQGAGDQEALDAAVAAASKTAESPGLLHRPADRSQHKACNR
jgi:sugar/nucleoside kinase (ribokinase family)